MVPSHRPDKPVFETDPAPPIPSEEVFRQLVSHIESCAIFFLDASGDIAMWNAGASRIFGYEAEEVSGQPFSLCFPGPADDDGEGAHFLQSVREEGPRTLITRMRKKHGATFWAESELFCLRDDLGHPEGYGVVLRDVTHEKAQNEERCQSQARLRSLLNTIADYILILKPDGTITFMNRTYQGRSSEEYLGQNVLWWVNEDDRQRFGKLWNWRPVVPARTEAPPSFSRASALSCKTTR